MHGHAFTQPLAWLSTFGLLCLIGRGGAAGTEPVRHQGVHSVKRYGAVGDGQAKDTVAIQAALNAAAQAGGGVVVVPPGRYLAGTIYLRSHVRLHLEAGATLLGSTDLDDYPGNKSAFASYTSKYVCHALIWGQDLHDVALTGRGTIDGQGGHAVFKAKPPDWGYRKRPYIIRLTQCRDVLVEDLTLCNSPMWVQHYLACDNVTLRGLTVHSLVNHNNDMIDVDCCRNVRISDCYGETGDDCITLKSTADRACENVVVTNCVVRSRCNGIKCGTESNGGFKNITISNCAVFDTGISGISLLMVDGGSLDGVTVNNISMNGVRVPVFLRLGNRARPFKKDMPKPGMGSFRNVVISNVVANRARSIGCAIAGLPGHPIRNVTLSNLRLTFDGGGTAKEVTRSIPEKPTGYPECTMFGSLPAYGFYCRHVSGLTFRDVDVRFAKPDARPALVCDDVKDLAVRGFTAQRVESELPTVSLHDVRGAMIQACTAPAGGPFLRLSGKTSGVSVVGNDLSAATNPLRFADPTLETTLHAAANRLKR